MKTLTELISNLIDAKIEMALFPDGRNVHSNVFDAKSELAEAEELINKATEDIAKKLQDALLND